MRNSLKVVLILGVLTVTGLLLFAEPTGTASAEKEIGFGETIKVEDHLVKGKTVILDFYSPYCPPCRRISPLLTQLAAKRSDLVVIKVNINRKDVRGIDWQSPLARQFSLQSVPHFKIYDGNGKMSAEGDPAFEKIMQWFQEAGIQ